MHRFTLHRIRETQGLTARANLSNPGRNRILSYGIGALPGSIGGAKRIDP
jgi:hypothetical protein